MKKLIFLILIIVFGFWYYNANAESYWANGKWNWRPDVNLTGNSQNNPSGQKCWSPERGYYVGGDCQKEPVCFKKEGTGKIESIDGVPLKTTKCVQYSGGDRCLKWDIRLGGECINGETHEEAKALGPACFYEYYCVEFEKYKGTIRKL